MMRALFAAIIGLCSFTALASGKMLSPAEFSAIEDAYSLEVNAAYPIWNISHSVCQARTVCPNGRVAYCKTFATTSRGGFGATNGSCRWMVVPGRAVRCQGYTLKRDFYGRTFWAYIDIPVSCY